MSHGRISESRLVVPTLRFLAGRPDGFATTSEIIDHLEEEFEPMGEDAEILEGRSDSRFSQIVRNMVSHRRQTGNIVNVGYVDYDENRSGLIITDSGRAHLAKQTAG